MAEVFEINAEKRERDGKGPARALRNIGKIPAVIYGDKKDPESITLEQRDITKLYNSGRLMSTLIQIDVDGEKTRAIARDVQLHPVKDFILHADFLRLGKGAKIAVEIPVNFLNEDTCPGLKQGGVLNVVRYQVELNCPASEIPESIPPYIPAIHRGLFSEQIIKSSLLSSIISSSKVLNLVPDFNDLTLIFNRSS